MKRSLDTSITPYCFARYDDKRTDIKPDNDNTRLLEKPYKTMSRSEKNRVAEILYGTFGSQRCSYKLGGWEWPMWTVLPRFLVKLRDYGWKEYYAPDKTALRKVLGRGAIEIVEA